MHSLSGLLHASHRVPSLVKNFAYVMDRAGGWTLAPAYDLVFSDGPGGQHTMAVAGEAVNPTESDILAVASTCEIDSRRGREILEQVRDAVAQWSRFASATGVSEETEHRIEKVIAGASIRRYRT